MSNEWYVALQHSALFEEKMQSLSPYQFTEWLRTIHLQYLQAEYAYQIYGRLIDDTKRLLSEIHRHCEHMVCDMQEKERRQEDCLDRFFLHECNGQCKYCNLQRE